MLGGYLAIAISNASGSIHVPKRKVSGVTNTNGLSNPAGGLFARNAWTLFDQ
jgi:hypothetical protein